VFCTLRTRLHCEVYSGDVKVAEHQAFNEACIDRGPGMYMLLLECYIDGNYVTTVQVCLFSMSEAWQAWFS
jgi:NAD kinase